MLRSIPKMLAKSLCNVLEGIAGVKDKELYSLCFPILCDLPAYVRRGRLTGLTEDERKVKAIMQTILIRAGVLRNDSEEEWNLWTTRKVIHSEWPKRMKILRNGKKVQQKKVVQDEDSSEAAEQEELLRQDNHQSAREGKEKAGAYTRKP